MNKDFWERIDRLEELANKATLEEWIIKIMPDGDFDDDCTFITTAQREKESKGAIAKVDFTEPYIIENENLFPSNIIQRNNAEFIAAANPTMIRDMIAELRRLKQENERLKIEAYDLDSSGGEMAKDYEQLEKEADRLAEIWRETDNA